MGLAQHRTSLSWKLVLPVASVVLVFAISVTFFIYNTTADILRRNMEQISKERTQRVQSELQMTIAQWKSLVVSLAYNPAIQQQNIEISLGYLTDLARNNPTIQSFFVVDQQGDVHNTTGKTGSVAERDYFQHSIKGQVFISDPIMGKLSGNPLIIISSPHYSNQTIDGVVGLAVELQQLAALVNREPLGKGGYSYMIDQQGVILAHPNPALLFTRGDYIDKPEAGELRELIRRMSAQESGLYYYRYQNEDKLAVYMPLGINGWSLASSIPTSEIFIDANRVWQASLIISLSSFALLAILLLLLIHYIVLRRLSQFMQGVQCIRDGQLDFRFKDPHHDEISILMQAFDHLTEQVQDHINRLVNQETDLRQNLEERTILLNEIHHRVKNNLFEIISLLHLQKNQFGDSQTAQALDISIRRVHSMALVHEQLFQSGRITTIDMEAYLAKLSHYLQEVYDPQNHTQVILELSEASLDISSAIALALICHELFSNSYRHAFAPNQPGQITLQLYHASQALVLEYQDNGHLQGPDWIPLHTNSIGLLLVEALVAQIHGIITFNTSEGCVVRIQIPISQSSIGPS
jgi:methyl-accepting chemotaxis protein